MKKNLKGIIKQTSPNSTKKFVRERWRKRERERERKLEEKWQKNNHRKNIFVEQIKANFKN